MIKGLDEIDRNGNKLSKEAIEQIYNYTSTSTGFERELPRPTKHEKEIERLNKIRR